MSGALFNNAYLVVCRRSGASVLIDAPADPGPLIAAARATVPRALLITHGHHDHIEGLAQVQGQLGVPLWLGEADRPALGGDAADLLELEGERLEFGELWLELIRTPGHTPGSTCFHLPAEASGGGGFLFSGDTLFPGGPGKTRTHADFKTILDSIGQRLLTLPPNTAVLPGHGEGTDIASAAAESAAFRAAPLSGDERGDVTWA